MSSCHHKSLPAVIVTSVSHRFTTTTFCTEEAPCSKAASTLTFNADGTPLLYPASAVITSFASASSQRSIIASGENPPKMTL